eukprot:gene22485-28613_t
MAMASGDDVLHLLQEAQTHFDFLMHDVEVRVARERLVFGNACLGAQAIVNVQEQVAGIAIPGRVADATLLLGFSDVSTKPPAAELTALNPLETLVHPERCEHEAAHLVGDTDTRWHSPGGTGVVFQLEWNEAVYKILKREVTTTKVPTLFSP